MLAIHPPPSISDQIWANERETPKPKTARPWYARRVGVSDHTTVLKGLAAYQRRQGVGGAR